MTIYKLMPWTWLADWFSNVGKQLDYLNSIWYDGTTSKYAYVMRSREEKINQTVNIFAPPGYPEKSITWNYGVITKCRRAAASPFGFDLGAENLSTRQIAILAALGITRA